MLVNYNKKPWALVCPWLKNSSHKESKLATAEHTYPVRVAVNFPVVLARMSIGSSVRGQVYHNRSLDARRKTGKTKYNQNRDLDFGKTIYSITKR